MISRNFSGSYVIIKSLLFASGERCKYTYSIKTSEIRALGDRKEKKFKSQKTSTINKYVYIIGWRIQDFFFSFVVVEWVQAQEVQPMQPGPANMLWHGQVYPPLSPGLTQHYVCFYKSMSKCNPPLHISFYKSKCNPALDAFTSSSPTATPVWMYVYFLKVQVQEYPAM